MKAENFDRILEGLRERTPFICSQLNSRAVAASRSIIQERSSFEMVLLYSLPLAESRSGLTVRASAGSERLRTTIYIDELGRWTRRRP